MDDIDQDTFLDCRCKNPSPINDQLLCKCGLFCRRVTHCNICKSIHKVRPRSFCLALNSKQGLKSIDTRQFLKELGVNVERLEAMGISV